MVTFPLDGDLSTVCNGEGVELTGKIPLSALKRGDYDVYLHLTDEAGKDMAVAVKETRTRGVPIGRIRAK